MKRDPFKLLVPLLALALVAAACGGGGNRPDDNPIAEIFDADAKDVKPPPRVDPKNLALPGLVVVTNSLSWETLVDSPNGRGAVVLFVQPGGPSDNRGLARGDLITEIDGDRVTNREHALALLHSRRGEQTELGIRGRNGKQRTVKIKGEISRKTTRPFLNALIKGNPNDPVLRYLRGAESSGGTNTENIADLDAALKSEPDFVEALAARANIKFNQQRTTTDKKRQQEFVAEALANWSNALDIDPRNSFTLTLQANAQNALGKPAQAKAEATKALAIDPSIPSANHVLARANIELKKVGDAAGPARAAIELNPYSNLTYYRTLAEVFKSLKRRADCVATLAAIVPYLEGTGAPALKKEAEQIKKEAKENCG